MIFVIYASSVRPRRDNRVMRRNFASKTPKEVQKASKFDELSKLFEYFQHKKEHFRVSFRRFRRVRRAKIPKLVCVEIFASTSASDARRDKPRPRSVQEMIRDLFSSLVEVTSRMQR